MTLENRGSAIVSHLSAKHNELTAAIDQSSAALSYALETSASASVGTLIGANDKLKSEMTSVLDQLSETNSALQSIIGNAGQNLAAVESALSERVKEFQSALGTVSSQVVSLDSDGLLDDQPGERHFDEDRLA